MRGKVRMRERCYYCGCVLRYRPSRTRENLMPAGERKALFRELMAKEPFERARELYREHIEPYGYREYWVISTKCPGCGRGTGDYRIQHSQDEAERIADAHNWKGETAEAVREVSGWQDRVRRWAEADGRQLAELLLSRFPEWTPHIQLTPASEMTAEPGTRNWDCSLRVEVPCENPAIPQPLRIALRGNDVRVEWFGHWHRHIQRREEAEHDDPEHLYHVLMYVDGLVTEQVVSVAYYQGDTVLAGTHIAADTVEAEIEAHVARRFARQADRAEIRSWRGTLDRTISLTTPTS